jgi:Holliday junction resolvase
MSKAKGARAERKCIRLLESAGYCCTRAGGSLGVFDVLAVGATDVRCVQVKSGTARLSRVERAAILALPMPANVTREYWRFLDYARAPIIERL